MDKSKLQEKEDNELMRLAALADKDAFEVLVLRYYREAVRYCQSLIREEAQAQDIVQDCFADIYVQRDSYRDSFSFRTFLYTLIKHKSIDYLRKAGRRERVCWDEQEETGKQRGLQDTGGPSPEEVYIRKERHREIAEWIGELPKDQRTALCLYALEGRSYQEIAAAMRKSVPQVKIAIYRARKKLVSRRNDR